MQKVLFVCTGNTCRSAMAEGMFKSLVKDEFEVSSAGIYAFEGEPASDEAIEAVKEYRVNIENHRASTLSKDMVKSADVIFCMTSKHKQKIIEQYAEAREKTLTILEAANMDGDIIDPYGMPLEEYKNCAKDIYLALKKICIRMSD